MRCLFLAVLLAAAAAASSGCSTYDVTPPRRPVLHPFASIEGERFARVCVLRKNQWYGHAVTVATKDNGVLVGATNGGTFFCYQATPGLHRIVLRAADIPTDTTVVELEAEAGKSYYLLAELPPQLHTIRPTGRFVDMFEAQRVIEHDTYGVVAAR